MSIRLLYVGAAVELAPAASLRALGGGAVLLPRDLPADLVALITEAVGGPAAGEFGIDDVQAVCERGTAGTVTLCIAGSRGPALARAVRAHALARGLPLETVPGPAAFDDCLVAQELVSLRHITAVLREQCPWDREQRAMDIVSYTIEEVYELAEVIMAERLDDQHDELGDVLFQVYFLSRLLEEQHAGDLGSVAAEIEDQAHPPPRAYLRRRGCRDGQRGARRVGARQARRRGPRGRVPQRAGNAARSAAGA